MNFLVEGTTTADEKQVAAATAAQPPATFHHYMDHHNHPPQDDAHNHSNTEKPSSCNSFTSPSSSVRDDDETDDEQQLQQQQQNLAANNHLYHNNEDDDETDELEITFVSAEEDEHEHQHETSASVDDDDDEEGNRINDMLLMFSSSPSSQIWTFNEHHHQPEQQDDDQREEEKGKKETVDINELLSSTLTVVVEEEECPCSAEEYHENHVFLVHDSPFAAPPAPPDDDLPNQTENNDTVSAAPVAADTEVSVEKQNDNTAPQTLPNQDESNAIPAPAAAEVLSVEKNDDDDKTPQTLLWNQNNSKDTDDEDEDEEYDDKLVALAAATFGSSSSGHAAAAAYPPPTLTAASTTITVEKQPTLQQQPASKTTTSSRRASATGRRSSASKQQRRRSSRRNSGRINQQQQQSYQPQQTRNNVALAAAEFSLSGNKNGNRAVCTGRKKEQALLTQALQRVLQYQRCELCLLVGPEGTGKSALAQSMRWKQLPRRTTTTTTNTIHTTTNTQQQQQERKVSFYNNSPSQQSFKRRESSSMSLRSSFLRTPSCSSLFGGKEAAALSATPTAGAGAASGNRSCLYMEAKFSASHDPFQTFLDAVNVTLDKLLEEAVAEDRWSLLRDRLLIRLSALFLQRNLTTAAATDQIQSLKQAFPVLRRLLRTATVYIPPPAASHSKQQPKTNYWRAGGGGVWGRKNNKCFSGVNRTGTSSSSSSNNKINNNNNDCCGCKRKGRFRNLSGGDGTMGVIERKNCFASVVCALLSALAELSLTPILMVLDNIHLADTHTMELVKTMMRFASTQSSSSSSTDFSADDEDGILSSIPCLIVATYDCNCCCPGRLFSSECPSPCPHHHHQHHNDIDTTIEEQRKRKTYSPNTVIANCCEACSPLRPCQEIIRELLTPTTAGTTYATAAATAHVVNIVMKPLQEIEVQKAVAELLNKNKFQDDYAAAAVQRKFMAMGETSCSSSDAAGLTVFELKKSPGLDIVEELAHHLYKHSSGSIYSVLLLLRLLFSDGILYQDAQHGWCWDIAAVKRELATPESILQLCTRSLESLSPLAQETLKHASLMLGDAIDDSALDLLLNIKTGEKLGEAEQAGLLVFSPQFGGYRFAHDWIRQAAYDMIPENERDQLHLNLGRKLLRSSSAAAVEKNVFIVVSLLNRGASLITDEKERRMVASLNLKAGEKAAEIAAFGEASEYVRTGIQLLSNDSWVSNYKMTLNLYSAAAEADYMTRHQDRVVRYIEEVVRHGRCMDDKLRAYTVLIRSMGQQDNLIKAVRVGVDVIRNIDEGFPVRVDHYTVSKELMKAKLTLQRMSEKEILKLPPMTDPVKIVCLKIMTSLFTYSYQARTEYTELLAIRSILLTLEYGLHENSAIAFAAYGAVLTNGGFDICQGYRCGTLAIAIADRGRGAKSISYFMVGVAINHWTRPLSETIETLKLAARCATESGDVETATFAALAKAHISFFSGTNISQVEDEVCGLIEMARSHRKRSNELNMLMFLRCLYGYSGNSSTSGKLSADIFEGLWDECLKADLNVGTLIFVSMDLAYMFGDYEGSYRMLKERNSLSGKHVFSTFIGGNEFIFKTTLLFIMMARKEFETRKFMRLANDMRRQYASCAGMNHRRRLLLIDAELMALEKKRVTDVTAMYEEAFEAATQLNCLNDMALTSERHGDFLLSRCEWEQARFHYEKAIDLYRKWGAIAKCKQLEMLIPSMLISTDTKKTIDSIEKSIPPKPGKSRLCFWRKQKEIPRTSTSTL